MMEAAVIGLGLWTPTFPSPERWATKDPDQGAVQPSCALLDARSKRGTSLVTRMAVEVACQAADQAGTTLANTVNVFGSALGEVQTAIDQIAMIGSADGVLSPTRFKNSVHNTAAGLVSIAVRNRGPSTAIAAGSATVAMTLLEGMCMLGAEGTAAIVAMADEPVAEPFKAGREYEPLAVAFCLAPPSDRRARLALLTGPQRRRCERAGELPPRLATNPVAAALPLLEAILARRSGRVPLELEVDEPFAVDLWCEASP